MGEDTIILHGGKSHLTGEQSTMELKPVIAVKMRAGQKNKLRHIPRMTNTALFRRDKNRCAYCGNIFSLSKLSRDHILPTSKGGSDDWDNCITACIKCNNDKTDMTIEQMGIELKYAPIVPTRPEYLLFTNKHITPEQLNYLDSFLKKS